MDALLEMSKLKPQPVQTLSSYTAEYKDDEGNPLIGTTRITGRCPSFGLTKWANDLGLKGESSEMYFKHSGNVGTVAHKMVECFNNGELYKRPDEWNIQFIGEYEDSANICFAKYMDFLNDYPDFEILLCEKEFVSNRYGYGGTIDMLAEIKGRKVLLDIKTTNSIFPEHKIQVGGAYWNLVYENGFISEYTALLNINRKPEEKYNLIFIRNENLWFKRFINLLNDYKAERKMIERHKTDKDKAKKKEIKLLFDKKNQ